jgi:hypothetical protein
LFRFGIIDIRIGEMIANPFQSILRFPSPQFVSSRLRSRNASPVWKILALAGGMISALAAEQFGDYTYAVVVVGETETITITDYPEAATGVVDIPAEIDGKPVTAIGAEAFINCAAITSVSVPAGVSSIGDNAFNKCTALAEVTLPEGLTSIGNAAFYLCGGLRGLILPTTVTSIGTYAFGFCTGLTDIEIPAGVTTINLGTFSDCISLESVVLPESGITAIEGSAFAKCPSLTSISTSGAETVPPSIVIPPTVTSLGTFVFLQCSALTSVVIPSGVPRIGTSAFELCTSLTTISIPSSVTAFGNDAFRSCSSLLSFEIASGAATTLGTNVFEGTTAMTSITVNPVNLSFSSQDGVLFDKLNTMLLVYPRGRIGPYVIPSGVTSIQAEAFRFAVGLTTVQIPSSVTAYYTEAFLGCSSLTSFIVDAGCPRFKSGTGALYSSTGKSLVAYPGGLGGDVLIPSTVTTISTSAFRYCSGLTSVTLPASIVTVNSTAFANCASLTRANCEGNWLNTNYFGLNVFQNVGPGFAVYFLKNAIGFTAPTWNGYPSVELGPISSWFTSYGLPLDSDPMDDANGDGVSLLLAYALDLNPNLNLSGDIPQPVFEADEMRMSFKAGAEGVTYRVETCTDFSDWTPAGVQLTEPDAEQMRTATVLRDGPSRFMRLVVIY